MSLVEENHQHEDVLGFCEEVTNIKIKWNGTKTGN